MQAVVDKIDPMGVVIMTAAGVAGYCGIKGPLTQILDAMQGNGSGPTHNIVEGITALSLPGLVGMIIGGVQDLAEKPKPSQSEILRTGYAMSNIVESGVLYTLAKNPGTPGAVAELAKTFGSELKIMGGFIK